MLRILEKGSSEPFVASMKKIASFDIFDTCVIRKCGLPEKIWDIMLDSLFVKEDLQSRITFKTQRKYAENKAAQIALYPDIKQIYAAIDFSQWSLNSDSVMQLEELTEEAQIIPNTHILPIISDYRQKGYDICFISDMYLSSDFLKKILKKYKIFNDNDSIYISCECNASKRDGSIYNYIQRNKKIKFKNWTHYGDNKISDVLIPREKGIHTHWYTYTDFTEHEKNWLQNASFYNHKNEIELYTGITRAIRLTQSNDSKTTLAANLVAPLYIPYVYFTLAESQKKGINQIYFLARDGHIFFQIAKQLQPLFPEAKFKYLKVSRKAVYPCFFYEGSYDEFYWILERSIGIDIESALARMGIAWEMLPENKEKFFRKTQQLNFNTIIILANYLSKYFCKDMVEISKEARENFLGYLDNNGFLRSVKKTIVDLGWEGSIRICLNKILKKEGFPQTFSFFWGYLNGILQGGDNCVSYFSNAESLHFPHAVAILEHYASANCSGSTIKYKNVGNTFIPIEKNQRNELKEIQVINERCSRRIAKNYLPITNNEEVNKDIFLCCGYRTLKKILEFPNNNESAIFSQVRADNFEKSYIIAQKLYFKDVIALFIWGNTFYPKWKEASASLTFGKKAKLFLYCAKIISSSRFMSIVRFLLNKIYRQ